MLAVTLVILSGMTRRYPEGDLNFSQETKVMPAVHYNGMTMPIGQTRSQPAP